MFEPNYAIDSPSLFERRSGDKPRLLIIDPNIEGLEGHFLELAAVISKAASVHSTETHLATSARFDKTTIPDSCVKIIPTFSCTKIRRWSLAPHGNSFVHRDFDGIPVGGNTVQRLTQLFVDRLHGLRPEQVLLKTSREIINLLKRFEPHVDDQILFSTSDDFMLLIAAAALKKYATNKCLRIGFLNHAPIQAGRACETAKTTSRCDESIKQLDNCLKVLGGHRLRFFATTIELCAQLNGVAQRDLWQPVDYPIRDDFMPMQQIADSPEGTRVRTAGNPSGGRSHISARLSGSGERLPLRAVCGGALRSEKGRRGLRSVVKSLLNDHLVEGRWRLGLQMSEQEARRLLPKKNRQSNSPNDEKSLPFDLAGPCLDIATYISWIKSADVGLFLYDARRYYTRCSGVLVEMLACGKPVIVPAGSWMSRQIAKENFEYLKSLSNEFQEMEAVKLPQRSKLPTRYRKSIELKASYSGRVSIFTIRVVNADDNSYLAVEVSGNLACGSQDRWHYLEIERGHCRLLVQHDSIDCNEVRLKLWSPFGEAGLKLESVGVQYASCITEHIKPNALGISFARLSDLPVCFTEIETHIEDYQQSAKKHAFLWRKKHSGEEFLKKLYS